MLWDSGLGLEAVIFCKAHCNFYQLRLIHQLQSFFEKKHDLAMVVHVVIASSLDYCRAALKLWTGENMVFYLLEGEWILGPHFHCAANSVVVPHLFPGAMQFCPSYLIDLGTVKLKDLFLYGPACQEISSSQSLLSVSPLAAIGLVHGHFSLMAPFL